MYWRSWEIAWSNLCRPKPESGFVANYLADPAGDHLFMWDSAFTAQFGLYGRRAFDFMGTLENFYAKQHGDGFICRQINSENGYDLFNPFDPNSTGPNILTWAEWRAYRATEDESRLHEVFWPLLSFHRWMRANRTWPSGLYWATGLSSGMSNQDRVPDGEQHHQHWSWVDTTAQAGLDSLLLAQMGRHLGEEELADQLNEEHLHCLQEVNANLWNEKTLFYHDLGPNGQFSPNKSIGAYWTLLDKNMVPEKRLEPFLGHLRDDAAFKRPHRAPSLAACSQGYDAESGDYWKGGVWSPTNYILLKGLREVGFHKLAHQIAVNHLENIRRVFERTDTFWEYYAPEEAAPGASAKADFVGWTGLSSISMLLEDVIGFQVDWPLRRVTWQRHLETDAAYGVYNLPLGSNGTLDLEGDAETIKVRTSTPFTLRVQNEDRKLQAAVPAGETELEW
jgi:glycogen debranching enzyme